MTACLNHVRMEEAVMMDWITSHAVAFDPGKEIHALVMFFVPGASLFL